MSIYKITTYYNGPTTIFTNPQSMQEIKEALLRFYHISEGEYIEETVDQELNSLEARDIKTDDILVSINKVKQVQEVSNAVYYLLDMLTNTFLTFGCFEELKSYLLEDALCESDFTENEIKSWNSGNDILKITTAEQY